MSVPPIVVMGVSGCGKTTVAMKLAARLHAQFLDADVLHSPSNIAKMASGHPLDDVDRAPWLDRVGRAMQAVTEHGGTPVMACSALKRTYRRRILALEPETFFVFLDVSREELSRRLRTRRGHFMPVVLLDSQLADLEPLAPSEPGITVAVNGRADESVDRIAGRIATVR